MGRPALRLARHGSCMKSQQYTRPLPACDSLRVDGLTGRALVNPHKDQAGADTGKCRTPAKADRSARASHETMGVSRRSHPDQHDADSNESDANARHDLSTARHGMGLAR